MKKVAFFISGLDSGGLENYLLRFLKFKSNDFSHIYVFCKGGKGGQLMEEYLNIPNVSITIKKISYFNPLSYIDLALYFRNKQIDSICDFTGNFAGLILFVAKQCNIKNRIVFYRGATTHFSNSYIKIKYDIFVKWLTYKYSTDVLSNSQAAFDYFFDKKMHDNRFEVIYNGLDANQYNLPPESNLRNELKIPEGAFVVGHTGRFNYAKNQDVILNVAKNLIGKYPDIYFILCGNGVKRNLEKRVQKFGIEKNVFLFENRSDIPLFLNSMDMYFFPSITEGQPNALIEAMLSGLPFVASNIEPIKETVGQFNDNLYDSEDVNGFVQSIENFYLNVFEPHVSYRNNIVRKFMANRFDAEIRLNQFFNKLVK